jgi:hypothetical protein
VALAEKTRIEVHVPGVPKGPVQKLIESIMEGFTQTFGRCIVIRARDSRYSTRQGLTLYDPTTVICADATLSFVKDRMYLAQYINQLHLAVQEELEEKSVLVAAHSIYHSID